MRIGCPSFHLVAAAAGYEVASECIVRAGVEAKFAATSWGQKLERRKAKAAMNDFDRYKAMVAKSQRSRQVRKTFNQLKKAAK